MNSLETIRILLVDDHAIVREGYRALLGKQLDLQVVAEAGDSAQAYREFQRHGPDLVVTDISLPDCSGLELIARIKQYDAAARILVFSMHQNPDFAKLALRADALGYVTKSSAPEVLLRAVRDVHARRAVLSPDIAQVLALATLGAERIALAELTVREFEILRLLVDGRGHDEIAEMLHVSPKTVANSHYLIKRKLAVDSDIQLTRLAIKLNVLDLVAL